MDLMLAFASLLLEVKYAVGALSTTETRDEGVNGGSQVVTRR